MQSRFCYYQAKLRPGKLEQEAEAKRQADAALAAEEEAFQRAQKAEEQRIAQVLMLKIGFR